MSLYLFQKAFVQMYSEANLEVPLNDIINKAYAISVNEEGTENKKIVNPESPSSGAREFVFLTVIDRPQTTERLSAETWVDIVFNAPQQHPRPLANRLSDALTYFQSFSLFKLGLFFELIAQRTNHQSSQYWGGGYFLTDENADTLCQSLLQQIKDNPSDFNDEQACLSQISEQVKTLAQLPEAPPVLSSHGESNLIAATYRPKWQVVILNIITLGVYSFWPACLRTALSSKDTAQEMSSFHQVKETDESNTPPLSVPPVSFLTRMWQESCLRTCRASASHRPMQP